MYIVLSILSASLAVVGVRAHGHLYDPPQRSSAWRYGYDVPKNYNDMGLNCGGSGVQWTVNGGKCGTCGDPWGATRDNEAGGKYAKGIKTGTYVKGDVMTVRVNLTAYHKGWFEFRLCAVNDANTKATQTCLDQNLLPVVGNNTSRFNINNLGIGVGLYTILLQLPAEMTCEQCVFQWLYNTGNSWNCDSTGCGIGRGPQEQFINCADIRIVGANSSTTGTPASGVTSSTGQPSTPSSTSSPGQSTSSPDQSSSSPGQSTASPSLPTSSTEQSTTQTTSSTEQSTTQTTSSTEQSTTQTTSSTEQSTTQTTSSTTHSCTGNGQISCEAVGVWRTFPGMANWCNINCSRGYCPSTHCSCTTC